MALEIIGCVPTAYDDCIAALAYNRFHKEIFSVRQGEKDIHVRLQKLTCLIGCVTGLAFDDTTRTLLSIALDGRLLIFGIGTPLLCLAWNPDTQTLALGGKGTIYLYHARTDRLSALAREVSPSAVNQSASEIRDEATNNRSVGEAVFEKLSTPLIGPEFCTADDVQSVAVHSGRVIAVGYDGCLCIYEIEKPKETYRKIQKAHSSAIGSLDINPVDQLILLGAYDGSLSVWTSEGRCIDRFRDVSDTKVMITYIPILHQYWVVGRGGLLFVFDPHGPTDITHVVPDVRSCPDGQILRFSMLHAPARGGVLLGATCDRKIILWNYSPTQACRIFKSPSKRNPSRTSVECLITVEHCDEITGLSKTDIIAGDASGQVCRWKYDAEKRSNVFRAEPLASLSTSALCLISLPNRNRLAVGGDDGRLTVLETSNISAGAGSSTTCLEAHTETVSALSVVGDQWLVSGSYDLQLCVWNIEHGKLASVVKRAHSAPIQCIEGVVTSALLASCAMHHLVKIWNVNAEGTLTLLRLLNHRIREFNEKKPPDHRSAPTVVTRSTADGAIGFDAHSLLEGRELLDEVMEQADVDAPEVTQVRWVGYLNNWITAANDEMVRLWEADGNLTHSFRYKGGSVRCLYVDNCNQRVLMSTLDSTVYLFNLDHPLPVAAFRGHEDVVCSIVYVAERDVYMTGSWDGTLRLWKYPRQRASVAQTAVQPRPAARRRSSQSKDDVAEPSQHPAFLNTDYCQLWKTLQLMEEYERRHTAAWDADDRQVLPSSRPLPMAPAHLEALLDDVNRRTLAQLRGNSQTTRQRSNLHKRQSFRRLSTRRRV